MLRNVLLFLLGTTSVLGNPGAELHVEAQHKDRGYYENTIRVRSGQSIQKALNKAPYGSRVVVEAGTYAEQISIQQDGISLIGKGAILVPPENPVENPCSGFAGPGTQAGICIVGKGLKLDEFKAEHRKVISVHKPVRDVTVTGFKVQKFVGFNILVLGADNAHVHDNELLSDASVYGFLTAGSTNTLVSDNVVASTKTSFIGVCMDNFSRVKVVGNKIDNFVIGLCIQTNGADIENNQVSQACYGAFLDPGVKDVKLCRNKFINPIPACGPPGATGILLDGSINARVEDNLVKGWKNSAGPASGIAIVDDPCTNTPPGLSCIYRGNKKAVAKGNVIKGNILKDNALDIYKETAGKGNVVRRNQCKTSVPPELCGGH